jgi:hypothetical protein
VKPAKAGGGKEPWFRGADEAARDHFSMAQAGVPAFSVTAGMKIKGKPKDFAIKAYKEFNDKAHHSPQDEMKPDWDFSGFVVLARFTLDVAPRGRQRPAIGPSGLSA